MYLKNKIILVTASILAFGAATAAQADVTISSAATQNMSCTGGVCQPTASDAALNVGDLENLLASGNVTVTTTGSGVQAANIDVTANLGWSANALTLDAYQSISVTAPVTVHGKSGLSIVTNDGGSGGELAFYGKGHASFTKLSGSLSIDGTSYQFVNSVSSLAAAIQKNPAGNYALAASYDAGKDGTYNGSPIQTGFTGVFEGLGNKVSNLTVNVPKVDQGYIGLFSVITGSVDNFDLEHGRIKVRRVQGKFRFAYMGELAGWNSGTISRCSSSGRVFGERVAIAGGLVGVNDGTIMESNSSATVRAGAGLPHPPPSQAGGLVGDDGGQIVLSYATGAVAAGQFAGGLVGGSEGAISNSYATGEVSGSVSGGLVSYTLDVNTTSVTASYAIGMVGGNAMPGGLIGVDQSKAGSLQDNYWDTDTSGVTNLSQGAGSPPNDPGITGLSTAQLQSGLPPGFDPSIWGENANVNNGLPYLLANPPQ